MSHANHARFRLSHPIAQVKLPLASPAVLVASLASNLLALALPLVVLQVYDRIIPNAALSTLTLLVCGMLVALLLDLLAKTARAYLTGWAGAQFEHEVARRMLDKLLAARIDAVENVPAGKHLERLASIEKVRDFYASQASLALIDAPFVLIFLGLMALIAGWLVLIPVSLLLIAIVLSVRLGEAQRRALDARAVWDDRRYNFIIEALSGIHTVKALAMERLIERRYERLMEANARAGIDVNRLAGMAQSVGTIFSQITMASVAGLGSLLVLSGHLSIGGLAACTMLAGRTVQPVLRFMGLWTRFQAVGTAREQIEQIDALPAQPRGEVPLTGFDRMKLDGVGFRYGPGQPCVVNEICLDFGPGDIIGITGGNGSGKTTLLHLMMGSLTPTQGSVRLNGRPPTDYSADSLGEQIAFLPQRPVLFNGTVLENLTMFQVKEHWQEAVDLAEKLGLDQVFARMPNGYDTRVGDTAASVLPAGVAQRITVARALVRRPKLILFDEANTALDGNSDAQLRDVLDAYRAQSAMVLVSFRPSLLRIADRRYTLARGRLIEHPTPDAADLKGSAA
ncbi:MAG: peptidase domain-containing ABC transporter [Rhodothalassiaceae bacterium]